MQGICRSTSGAATRHRRLSSANSTANSTVSLAAIAENTRTAAVTAPAPCALRSHEAQATMTAPATTVQAINRGRAVQRPACCMNPMKARAAASTNTATSETMPPYLLSQACFSAVQDDGDDRGEDERGGLGAVRQRAAGYVAEPARCRRGQAEIRQGQTEGGRRDGLVAFGGSVCLRRVVCGTSLAHVFLPLSFSPRSPACSRRSTGFPRFTLSHITHRPPSVISNR